MRASACQLADESSTLHRAGEEREGRSLARTDGKIRGHGRRAADEDVPGKSHRRGADIVVNDSSTATHASERDRVVRPSVAAREGKGDAAARGEFGKHPDHDGGISGRQDFANAGGP